MPSPPTIDLETLLTPIAGDNPAGEYLRYEGIYDTLQELMREDDNLEQGDWQRETKSADWRAVVATATDALATKSKDLQLAAWLTRALVKRHGFAGLRDGFQLLRELQERFWDHIYPELEDGDAEFRAGPFEGLNVGLPFFIRQIPLTQSGNGDVYSLLHWTEAQTVDNLARQNAEAYQTAISEGKITNDQLNKAVATTPRTFYETLFEDLQDSVDACERLDRLSDEKFGRIAPSFVAIKKALDECLDIVRRVRKEKREKEGVRDTDGAIAPTTPQQTNGEIRPERESSTMTQASSAFRTGDLPLEPQNRADALRRLEAVAGYFRRTEPHSPVAYLVERAVRWGTMSLEEWLREVIKGDDVLDYVREHLGIKEASASSNDSDSSNNES